MEGKKYNTGKSSSIPEHKLNGTEKFIKSLNNPEVIERVRSVVKHAHVFKLPSCQTSSSGWRGAEWREKVWQGTVKVVERNDMAAVILEDSTKNNLFAICPVRDGAIDRCIDSSRYFVLRIENTSGRHMFIGVAFNERSDAFDFNAALEDIRREREAEVAHQHTSLEYEPSKDYSLKKGETIHVSVPKVGKKSNERIFKTTNEEFDSLVGTEAFANFYGEELDSDDSNSIPEKREISSVLGSKKMKSQSEVKKTVRDVMFLRPSSRDTPSRKTGCFTQRFD